MFVNIYSFIFALKFLQMKQMGIFLNLIFFYYQWCSLILFILQNSLFLSQDAYFS